MCECELSYCSGTGRKRTNYPWIYPWIHPWIYPWIYPWVVSSLFPSAGTVTQPGSKGFMTQAQVHGARHLVAGTSYCNWYQLPGTRCQKLGTWYPVPGTLPDSKRLLFKLFGMTPRNLRHLSVIIAGGLGPQRAIVFNYLGGVHGRNLQSRYGGYPVR